MDTKTKFDTKRKLNPAQNANPISVLFFLYMFPIFKRTFKFGLTEDDLFQPLDAHKSSILGEKLERIWKEEYRKHKKYALHISLYKLFGLPFILTGIVKLVDELLLVVITPYSLGKLVSYFEKGQTDVSINEAYIYTGAIILCLLADVVIAHPSMMAMMHISMKLRVACSSLIYRKTLRLSRRALGNTTVGQVVNLLSNDVSKFDQGFLLTHFIWIGPIQTAVGTYMLYREIGYSAFFGMAFLLSFIPMQIWLGKRTSVLRLQTALRTDERVRLMNEIISGIQVIKMYCWEKPFNKLITYARTKEVKVIRKHAYLMGMVYSFEAFVTRTSIFISVLGFVLLGNFVTAEKVFAITAIYNVLRPVITILFSISISSLAEINISVKRLQTFLDYEELPQPAITHVQQSTKEKTEQNGSLSLSPVYKRILSKDCKLELSNVNAKWLDDNPEDTLNNINLSITSKQLLAIIGPVGSGKSSILNVILKELPISSGLLEVHGRVSYSCQEPWLFSGSVRQNIIFNDQFDEERYKKVIQVCALEADFVLLPFGDKTLVGEKGKSLSGGQKARINLARCVYKEADIYLLDDPLSAVDANVGKHLYEKCIKGFLNDKICILITHQLQYLQNADKIVIMKEGEIQQEGKYRDLMINGLDFAKLLEEMHIEDEEKDKKIKSRQNSEMEEEINEEDGPDVEKEFLGSGSIDMKVYWAYLKAGGGKVMISLLVLVFIIGQIVANAGDYYLTYWVNKEQDYTELLEKHNLTIISNLTNITDTFDDIEPLRRDIIIYSYTAVTIATIIFAVTHTLYYMYFFTVASINLHNQTFSSIIKATMRFYNNNPSGRILNRFSKDLGTIDEYIPNVLFDVIECGLLLAGVIVLSSIVNIFLLLPAIGLMIFFYFIRMVYIKTSRSVKRIEAITRSPIYGHMTTSMGGLPTIRAFSAQEVLIHDFDHYQDCHSAAWYLFIASSRCFGFWLDIICITFIAVATFSLIKFGNNIYGGDIGLIITQYLGLMGSLQWGMRQWSELENQMTSVERVLEYTQAESEPERKPLTLPKNWPEQGKVEFRNVNLRYMPNEPHVLKNLNFTVHPSEKVGIVGRTGAGKSSTIAALFQLYNIEGSIFIDDVDTTKVPLDDVRTKISIIPQEPVLFSGSMRKNLDPFEEYSDEILWSALEQVELKDVISDLPAGLNTNVMEGGTNFSVGQRQLVCLARALIRNNKILVLDEATANVDPHTDNLIQQTIRNKFKDCTVLTIAHRLHTVMDSDKILVMSAGTVEEFDHPHVLLQNEKSLLKHLVRATGKTTAKNLEAKAKNTHENSKNK